MASATSVRVAKLPRRNTARGSWSTVHATPTASSALLSRAVEQGQIPQLDRHEFEDRRAAPRLQNLDEDRKRCRPAAGRRGPAYSVPGERGQGQLVVRHFA